MDSEEVNVTVDDNHIDEISHLNDLLRDAMGEEMSTEGVSSLEDGFDQKDIIDKSMEDENGEVISGEYSEYSASGDASEQAESGSGDADEEVSKIKSIMVTVNVKSTDENYNKYTMKEDNKNLRLQQLEEFSSMITESDRKMVEIQDEEKDLNDRHNRTQRTSHDIVFYCVLL